MVSHGGGGDTSFKIGIGREPGFGVRGGSHGGAPNGASRFTQTLHGLEQYHHAGPFGTVGLATSTAFAAPCTRGKNRPFSSPLTGQCANHSCLDAGFLFRPFRCLGLAIFLAHHIFFELIKADGAFFNVFFIVNIFGDPNMSDGHCHGRVGTDTRGQPLPLHNAGSIVVVGIDKNHLDPFFLEPLPPHGRLLTGIGAPGGIGVVGPVNDHLRIFQRIFQEIVLFRHAQSPVEPVGVGCTPMPPLPGIGIIQYRRKLKHIHKTGKRTHFIADNPPIVMG